MTITQLNQKLKDNNYNLTNPRKKILAVITKKDGIFSAKQLIKQLPKIDRTSIYRTLEILEKLNIIKPVITLSGEQYFEKNETQNHHHHIICTNCHKTKCVKTEPKMTKIENFKNIQHLLILTGICKKCFAKI